MKNIMKMLSRTNHKSACVDNSKDILKATEITIPVPWGHLAGKWWGPQNVRPILGLHGWQDNCASFDTLAPLLPKHVGFLAIDYPGHGLSSRFPHGFIYNNSVDYLLVIRRVVKYFAWEKVSLLGHSMSGFNCFMYSAIYPETVDFAISIDALKLWLIPPEEYSDSTRYLFDRFLEIDERNMKNEEPPAYKYEDLINKLHHDTHSSIKKESAHYVLDRGIEQSSKDPEKYYFTRDSRLKIIKMMDMSKEQYMGLWNHISCPYLAIKFNQGMFSDDPVILEVVEKMKTINPQFEFHRMDGKHHTHLNSPPPAELVSLINAFINKHYHPEIISKL